MLLKCFFPKDEQGAAASLSVTLDTELGDFPVQHRVVSIWFVCLPFWGGHWDLLETAKPRKKIIQNQETKKNSVKTEKHLQNC